MTTTNKTIISLTICLVALSVICIKNMPLTIGRYDAKTVKLVGKISRTPVGLELIGHYFGQMKYFGTDGVGPFTQLAGSRDISKVVFAAAGLIFAGLIALVGSICSLIVFLLNGRDKPEPVVSKKDVFLILLLIIINGTVIRLCLASACYGNFDMHSYEMVADIVSQGGNVYAQTSRYNYSPLWFNVLGALKKIHLQYPSVPFHFVVKSFLCGVDLLTLMFLLLIAHREKQSLIKPAVLFFLNPVSFLLTGYHGQFENFAILFVVIGLYLYSKAENSKVLRTALLWIFASFAMTVKHNIFYELIICLNAAIKRYRIKLLLFVVSTLVFLALFAPYWSAGRDGIIRNVFMYSSGKEVYGICSLFDFEQFKYAFIAGMFLFPLFLKSEDIIEQCLLGMLFFLAFTSGFSIQYFVLPVALGALRPSKGSLIYSLAAGLFILGNIDNVYLPGFHLVRPNAVWLAAMYWFITEIRNTNALSKTIRLLRQRFSAAWPLKRTA